MRLSWLSSCQFQRRLLVSLVLSTITVWYLLPTHKHEVTTADLEHQYPLLWRHVHTFNGTGGGTSTYLCLQNHNEWITRHCSSSRLSTDCFQRGIFHPAGCLPPTFSRRQLLTPHYWPPRQQVPLSTDISIILQFHCSSTRHGRIGESTLGQISFVSVLRNG